MFESKKTFATFEVNRNVFSVQPITKFFILLQKISNYSHKKKSNPTGQPKFLDTLFRDNSYSYLLPFMCIIEALNSSLKSGTVLQVHRKPWMTDQTLKMNHAQLAMLGN